MMEMEALLLKVDRSPAMTPHIDSISITPKFATTHRTYLYDFGIDLNENPIDLTIPGKSVDRHPVETHSLSPI